jgi:diketogulonate reductase-like aldo/keto reductase
MNIPNIKLNDGTTIPQVGFGLWRVKKKDVCIQAVQWALEAGYRHFDTAQIYGNEAFLGDALSQSDVKRKDLFITTKIWNENQFWDNMDPSFEESLQNLRTDYVDLLLLHFPVTETRRPAWRKLQQILKTGKVKSIGVSNYTVPHLEELLRESSMKPVVNQVELHVFLQQPELVAFCKKHDIVVEAYSPLAHGQGLNDPVLKTIADKHGKSPAQVMIRWCIEQGTVPLPKSVHQDRIRDNLNVFDFKLDASDMKQLATLERDMRTCWDPTNVA